MLELDVEFIEVKFKGEVFNIYKPTNKQIKSYNVELTKADNDELKEIALLNFLEELGLKKEIYESLNPSQLKMILSELYDSEKN